MCGICGIVDFNRPVDPAVVARMNSVLVHRGPDEGGLHAGGDAVIAMRRLSIIDLAGSHQPMSNDDGTIWIVFNGEIYNFREKRKLLESRGRHFNTHGDTEVILRLYEEFDLKFVDHLNGMFALAIWDSRRGRVVLARDRLGIKPLYYSLQDGRLRFASESKAILQDESLSRTIDVSAIIGFLNFNSLPNPNTMFREIRKLSPGHLAVFNREGLQIDAYWDVDFSRKRDWRESELLDAVDELLRDSVRLRLISDVPLGGFLSGGVDSSLIVAMMAGMSSHPVEAFSIGFGAEGAYMNELEYSEAVAKRYGAHHHKLTLNPDDLIRDIERVVWFLDEPCGDAAAFLTLALSEFTRQHVTVALSGIGGDELFAGYRRYLALKWHGRFLRIPKMIRNGLIGPALGLLPEGRASRLGNLSRIARKFVRDLEDTARDSWSNTISYLPDYDGPMFAGAMIDVTARSFRSESFDALWEHIDHWPDPVDQATYLDIKTYLPDQLLFLQDKMTMAASLEAREPLLDYRLVELAASIPTRLRLPGRQLKPILKRVAEKYLPHQCIYREKKGFVAPIGAWFRGPLRDRLEDALSPARVRQRGIFQVDFIEWLKNAFFVHKRDFSVQMFQAFMLELWFRQFVDGDGRRFAGTTSPVLDTENLLPQGVRAGA